jgi:hypothetical protein
MKQFNRTSKEYGKLEIVTAVTEAFTADAGYEALTDRLQDRDIDCHELWSYLIDFALEMEEYYQDKWECNGGTVDFIETVSDLVQQWVTLCLIEENINTKFDEVRRLSEHYKKGTFSPALRPKKYETDTVTIKRWQYDTLIQDSLKLGAVKGML